MLSVFEGIFSSDEFQNLCMTVRGFERPRVVRVDIVRWKFEMNFDEDFGGENGVNEYCCHYRPSVQFPSLSSLSFMISLQRMSPLFVIIKYTITQIFYYKINSNYDN